MSSHDDGNMTWAAAYDLIIREINRLQTMPTSREQQRYSEAVLLKEVALLSSMMVKTVRKILVYLQHVEYFDLSSREELQRGILTCYLAECVQVWTVHGLPCMANYPEFLDLSERLAEVLHLHDPSAPPYRRDSNPLMLGLLSHIRWAVLGQCVWQPDLMLPYRGNEGRGRAAARMYRALCNLTCGDTVNRYFPYAFLYGTYLDITTRTQVGLNRRHLETYLHEDVRQVFIQHKRALLMENSADFPDFGKCAPDMNWHALQVACRSHNLRQQWQQARQTEENIEEKHEIHFSDQEVFAWRTTSQWPRQTPTCCGEWRGVTRDGEYVSMSIRRNAQSHYQNYTRDPAPVKTTDREVVATHNTRRDGQPIDEDRGAVGGPDSG